MHCGTTGRLRTLWSWCGPKWKWNFCIKVIKSSLPCRMWTLRRSESWSGRLASRPVSERGSGRYRKPDQSRPKRLTEKGSSTNGKRPSRTSKPSCLTWWDAPRFLSLVLQHSDPSWIFKTPFFFVAYFTIILAVRNFCPFLRSVLRTQRGRTRAVTCGRTTAGSRLPCWKGRRRRSCSMNT